MKLVDTSIWVDFLRGKDDRLEEWLVAGRVAIHPFVVGELACGRLQSRATVLHLLKRLPAVPVATHEEALHFIVRHKLYGTGLGYVDVHLLAAAALSGYARIATRDTALAAAARLLGLAVDRY